jgi:hypothetical protein
MTYQALQDIVPLIDGVSKESMDKIIATVMESQTKGKILVACDVKTQDWSNGKVPFTAFFSVKLTEFQVQDRENWKERVCAVMYDLRENIMTIT